MRDAMRQKRRSRRSRTGRKGGRKRRSDREGLEQPLESTALFGALELAHLARTQVAAVIGERVQHVTHFKVAVEVVGGELLRDEHNEQDIDNGGRSAVDLALLALRVGRSVGNRGKTLTSGNAHIHIDMLNEFCNVTHHTAWEQGTLRGASTGRTQKETHSGKRVSTM